MASAVFTVGDVGTFVEGNVQTSLVGAAVEVHMRKPDGTVLEGAAVITDEDEGVWRYSFTTGQLDQPGTWIIEAEVTFGGGARQTFGASSFRVRPQLA